jgi:hypothetical protein
MRKKSPYKRIKDKAWSEFSRYIRLKYADRDGMVKCVTCGAKKHWKEMQAGHAIQGRGNYILFNEKFVYPQDFHCNGNPPYGLGGNYQMFMIFLMKEKGITIEDFEKEKQLSMKPFKISISEMGEIYNKYKTLSRELENNLKNK